MQKLALRFRRAEWDHRDSLNKSGPHHTNNAHISEQIMSTLKPSNIPISADGENAIQEAVDELEQLAEEIRNRGRRGHAWGELQPQWERLRTLESGLRRMIES